MDDQQFRLNKQTGMYECRTYHNYDDGFDIIEVPEDAFLNAIPRLMKRKGFTLKQSTHVVRQHDYWLNTKYGGVLIWDADVKRIEHELVDEACEKSAPENYPDEKLCFNKATNCWECKIQSCNKLLRITEQEFRNEAFRVKQLSRIVRTGKRNKDGRRRRVRKLIYMDGTVEYLRNPCYWMRKQLGLDVDSYNDYNEDYEDDSYIEKWMNL